MSRLFLALALMLPSWANAQEMKRFYTVTQCGTPMDQFEPSISLGEEILFEGSSVVFGIEGVPFIGGMLFTVNQNTGSWTLFSVYGDGTVCTVAFGEEFAPVVN